MTARSVSPRIASPRRRLLIPLFIVVLSITVDQATKVLARATLASRPPIVFGGGLARLTYAENPGAFLGLGADLPAEVRFWLFTVVAVLLLVALVIFALRSPAQTPLLTLVAISLFVAGGVGNLIDRIFNDGRVVDFMQVGVGWLRTGVFNVADMALMAGVGLVVLSMLRRPAQQEAQIERG